MVSHESINLSEAKPGLKLAVDDCVGGSDLTAVEAHVEHILMWAHDSFGADLLVSHKELFSNRRVKFSQMITF